MANVDIFAVKPHVVSRDLKGYTILLYGAPKVGKTTMASKFDKALLLGFEAGYLTIPGIMALPINSWSEFKTVLKQLKTDEGHETYSNIIIDTVDIAYDLCEKYICNKEGVETIGDLAYGKGYNMVSKEFDEALRSIPQMRYGLIMISHSQDKTFTDENGKEYNQICPTLGNRPRLIVDRMSDLIIYAHPIQEEDGSIHSIGFMRQTPRFVAGSRFKYIPDSIEFNYENLVNAIGEAIDKEAAEHDNKFVTDAPAEKTSEPQIPNFNELMDQFNTLVEKIQNATGSAFGTDWAPRIVEITDKYLGKGKKVSDATPKQIEQLELIVNELTEQVGMGL
jgi:hypothetical protein